MLFAGVCLSNVLTRYLCCTNGIVRASVLQKVLIVLCTFYITTHLLLHDSTPNSTPQTWWSHPSLVIPQLSRFSACAQSANSLWT